MDCEVLIPLDLRPRQRRMLEAMLQSASSVGIDARCKSAYSASSKWLMTWGMGHRGRRSALDDHMRTGGRVIGWDLGYWDRQEQFRLTIDQDHPQKLLCDMPAFRFDSSGIKLREDRNPIGPILLIGLGEKSRAALGYTGTSWEHDQLRRIRLAYPLKTVKYRPKRPEPFSCEIATGSIEEALEGCSLVVCRHSNVAVDACIAGIPVVCEDGAAASLYCSDLRHPIQASREQRLRFLQNLAWWQWKPSEAIESWNFIKQVICG